jgi:PAS domain S-box-containing protein
MTLEIMTKRNIFFIRLLVIIIISYLTIFGPIKDNRIVWSYIFIAFYLSTNLFLPYIPDRYFISSQIFYALVFFDTGMVSLGIYLSGHAGTDFYLVYFLILGLAAMNISLKYLMINTVVFTFLYGWVLYQKNLLEGDVCVTYALRLPFMIIIAFFFGFIVETTIKDREKRLRESEEKYRQLFTTESDAIVVFDEETSLVKDINDAALNLYGYDREELLQLKAADILAYPGKAAHDEKKTIDGNTQNILLQYHKKKDGTIFPAEVSSGAFFFQNRRMISTIIRDISERIQAEKELKIHRHHLEDQVKERTSQLASAVAKLKREMEQRKQAKDALQESKEHYRLSLEATPDPIVVYDIEGKASYVNPAFEQTFGWSSDEVLGQPIDFDLNENLRESQDLIKQMLQGEKIQSFETRRLSKDGRLLDIQISSSLFKDQEDKIAGRILIFRDVTKTKLLQEQLIRSERLAATGQLAASVAHEINSPLQAIVFLLDIMENKHKGENKILDDNDFNLLTGAVGNIRDTVQNLLDLNRPGQEEKQPANVNEIIEKTFKLSRSHLNKNKVKVNLELASNVPIITASPQQLSQVFLNLIKNSIEAMSGESSLRSGRESRTSIEGEMYIKTNIENEDIVIEVSDTGPGILEEDLFHIFDPFYTGKKKMGTGVGLSICNGIIKGHDGNITAKNSPEGGAVFTITLPVG